MRVRHSRRRGERIELKMTSMIDIVFLLLVFFIMTFTIAAPEGDFSVHMPVAAGGKETEPDPHFPPLKVRLLATSAGHLAGIRINEKELGRSIPALNAEIRYICGDVDAPTLRDVLEVEIDADYPLRFEYVVDAMTAVSGYRRPDGRLVRVCEKIEFAPPRTP